MWPQEVEDHKQETDPLLLHPPPQFSLTVWNNNFRCHKMKSRPEARVYCVYSRPVGWDKAVP